jgi:beta-xylosidase
MYSGCGAVTPNYAIGYATSKSPMGPFTKYAGNPIAYRGGNVVGPGHHCVVTGPDGKLWMLYHQKWDDSLSYSRFLALDPLWFDAKGELHARTSRDTPEPAP